MPWPQTVDYNCSIQDPQQCFADDDLRNGTVAEGMIPGLPLSYSGNFATVYKIHGAQGAWAVKCFTRKVENLALRYKEISAHLEEHRRRFVVDFQYLEEGIFVGGAWHPVVKMQWVEGFTLNELLRDHCGNPAFLEQLCALWLRLGRHLRRDRMAHGDLQHGNVLLVPGGSASSLLLRLVDYDGMWVPALAGLPPGEVGHANYQHPQRLREGGYGPHIDRFSQLAIYTALRCLLAGGKPLWSAHDNGENLLFREADFLRPAQSKLFAQLLALPDTNAAALAAHLLLASQGALEDVPLLSDLLAGLAVAPLAGELIDRVGELIPAVRLNLPRWIPAPETIEAPRGWLPEEDSAAELATVTDLPVVRDSPDVLGIRPEQQHAAEELFAHAGEVIRSNGDPAYALELLLACCKLDPTSVEHREMLRLVGRVVAAGRRTGWFESLAHRPDRTRIRGARAAGEHRKVLEHGEELLARHPGDAETQMEMAQAAEGLGLNILAFWLLREAHEQGPDDPHLRRAFERCKERQKLLGRPVDLPKRVGQARPFGEGDDEADTSAASAPPPPLVTPEQRRGAEELFAHATEVMRCHGDPSYALELLLTCCKLDPTSVEHRKMLREVGRSAARRSGWLGSLTNLPARNRLRAARGAGDHRKVLQHGEELLARLPGDLPAQLDMAEAAEALALPAVALWMLKEAHDQAPVDLVVLRNFARLCERLDKLSAAVALWKQVQKGDSADLEAADKIKNLSAADTIARSASLV
jgi:tRNA U34 5-methylaminomethyl-2-thiouridine-forming methyltransferase MnmC